MSVAKPVGASWLAMNVNGNAGIVNERGVLEFFASKLAPTRGGLFQVVGEELEVLLADFRQLICQVMPPTRHHQDLRLIELAA